MAGIEFEQAGRVAGLDFVILETVQRLDPSRLAPASALLARSLTLTDPTQGYEPDPDQVSRLAFTATAENNEELQQKIDAWTNFPINHKLDDALFLASAINERELNAYRKTLPERFHLGLGKLMVWSGIRSSLELVDVKCAILNSRSAALASAQKRTQMIELARQVVSENIREARPTQNSTFVQALAS